MAPTGIPAGNENYGAPVFESNDSTANSALFPGERRRNCCNGNAGECKEERPSRRTRGSGLQAVLPERAEFADDRGEGADHVVLGLAAPDEPVRQRVQVGNG